MTFSTNNGFIQNITCGTINTVRVSCESVAGRRPCGLHINTRLMPARVSTGFHVKASPAEGRASPEGLLKVERLEFRCLGVQVFRV